MNIFVFTLAWWSDHDHAWSQSAVLNQWLVDVNKYYLPRNVFVACGTWSDPIHSPLPGWVEIINGGAKKDRPYDAVWWNYSGTALIAGLSYALTRPDWDLLILHDTDMLVGAVNFDSLLREFISRPETFLSCNWHGRPCGGSIAVWKPAAAVKWLNQRRRPNFIEKSDGQPDPMLLEDEMGEIHKGEWWNPWTDLETMRYDYGQPSQLPGDPLQILTWPFVRMPHPDAVARYTELNTSRAKSVVADWPVKA